MKVIQDKTPEEWKKAVPVLEDLTALRETMWRNPRKRPAEQGISACSLGMEDIRDAEARLRRFAPYLARVFPGTARAGGILESPLREIPSMAEALGVKERLILKCDSHLPVSGSIKARGGIYEVLCVAEKIALESGMLTLDTDYAVLAEPRFWELFSKYTIAVGSTGNLGLSIGIMSAKLGFQVTVHMSADARQWKKDLLREKGVTVIEYAEDYSKAISEGRRQAEKDPWCHFVDDENSKNLFLGYGVAALRLQKQLMEQNVPVDEEHPLFVYLPCGVGGGPGGVAFGLKQVFGDAVHCFFAEPTHAPCMILGMATRLHAQVCVGDFGIDNRTAADGLAVGRPSQFVGKLMEPFLSGCYTISDEHLYRLLTLLAEREGIRLEPSALAGMTGPQWILHTEAGLSYQRQEGLTDKMSDSTHIVWATGGSMVPEADWLSYEKKGKQLLAEGQ